MKTAQARGKTTHPKRELEPGKQRRRKGKPAEQGKVMRETRLRQRY
jgi:hypothetical protein